MLGQMFEIVLDAFSLPARCAVCHAWPAGPVCAQCLGAFTVIVRRCACCALPLGTDLTSDLCLECNLARPSLDRCVAATDYAFPWNHVVASYKFNSKTGHARLLVRLMQATPHASSLLARAQLVVPVPLSAQRLRDRGYNQAWELARRLAPGKARTDLLVRRWDTAAQSRLHREDRLLNLRHALAVPQALRGQVAGQRVLLIDDVMTTGATLHAASLALRAAGAHEVCALVFARAAKSGDAQRRPRSS